VDLPKQKELQDLNNDKIEGKIDDHLKKLISSCEKETAGGWRLISHTVQLLLFRQRKHYHCHHAFFCQQR